STYKTAVVTAFNQYSFEDVPTPAPTSGQVLVKILSIYINPGYKHFISGHVPFLHTFPVRPGGGAIGRVEAVGEDSLTLSPGQLVYVDPAIVGRDAPEEKIVHGSIQGFNPRQIQLSTKAWTQGTISQKTIVPVESVVPVNEEFWLKTKGYELERIWMVNRFIVPYVGYERAQLQPGDTVLVAFATGGLGNAAIELALALGAAHVVGLGRTQSKLDTWHASLPAQYASRVSTVALTGDIPTDTAAIIAATPSKKGVDVYFDLTPTAGMAEASAHLSAGIGAVKTKGRVIFMGNVQRDVTIPYGQIVMKDLSVHGAYMYDMSVPKKVFRLAESGLLSVDHYSTEVLEGGLDAFGKAMDLAGEKKGTRFELFIRP
ncbi:GroES-like protein, partial [Clavulina sp. PMI_390]